MAFNWLGGTGRFGAARRWNLRVSLAGRAVLDARSDVKKGSTLIVSGGDGSRSRAGRSVAEGGAAVIDAPPGVAGAPNIRAQEDGGCVAAEDVTLRGIRDVPRRRVRRNSRCAKRRRAEGWARRNGRGLAIT